MLISHDDPRLSWFGAISLERTASYTRPWRLPFDSHSLFDPGLALRAGMPAGVRVTMVSSTRQLSGRVIAFREPTPPAANRQLDLAIDGQPFASLPFTEENQTFAFTDLPAGEKRIELWLPTHFGLGIESLAIDDGATLAPWHDPRPRWVTYGSSITHCGGARSPLYTWPAIVARAMDWNLTALGYGGQCHLDAQVARIMRDLPADAFSICAGINIYGHGSLNARSFESALIGFVQILREKHPDTPIALISPIFSCDRETTPNKVDWTLQDYRSAVASATSRLQAAGDAHVFYASGLDLFDAPLAHLLPDNLHPNAEGYEIMAQRFLQHVAPRLSAGLTAETAL